MCAKDLEAVSLPGSHSLIGVHFPIARLGHGLRQLERGVWHHVDNSNEADVFRHVVLCYAGTLFGDIERDLGALIALYARGDYYPLQDWTSSYQRSRSLALIQLSHEWVYNTALSSTELGIPSSQTCVAPTQGGAQAISHYDTMFCLMVAILGSEADAVATAQFSVPHIISHPRNSFNADQRAFKYRMFVSFNRKKLVRCILRKMSTSGLTNDNCVG